MSAPSTEQIQKAVDRLRTELVAQLDMMEQPDLLASDVATVLNALAHVTEERDRLREKVEAWQHAYEELRPELLALIDAHERVMTLSAKWRAEADAFSVGHELALGRVRSSQLRADADELDAILSPQEGTPS